MAKKIVAKNVCVREPGLYYFDAEGSLYNSYKGKKKLVKKNLIKKKPGHIYALNGDCHVIESSRG